MKKTLFMLAIMFFIPFHVSAEPGLIGMGWEDGISLRYPSWGPLGMQYTAKMNFTDTDGDQLTNYDVAGYANLSILKRADSVLRFFAGGGITSTSVKDIRDDFFVRAGLQQDFFASNKIVISAKAGSQAYARYGALGDPTAYTLSLWGTIGIHWYLF